MDTVRKQRSIYGVRITSTHLVTVHKLQNNRNFFRKSSPALGTWNGKPALLSRYSVCIFGLCIALRINRLIVDTLGNVPEIFKNSVYMEVV